MNICVLSTKIVIYGLAYFIAGYAGHFVVRKILELVGLKNDKLGGNKEETAVAAETGIKDEKEESGLKNAGAVIGVIERIFILTLVLMGQYTLIGLIITAKSIVRFPDLKDRKFAEYYLIGTLTSVLFALVIGILSKLFF